MNLICFRGKTRNILEVVALKIEIQIAAVHTIRQSQGGQVIALKVQKLQVSERANVQRDHVVTHIVGVKIGRVAESLTEGVNRTLHAHLSP